ncbi:hypothetical protein ACJ41O_005969 [Fusarium nematophilum]
MSGFPVVNGTEVLRLPPDDYPYALDFDNPRQQYTLEHYLIFGLGAPLALIALVQRYYTKIFLSKGLQLCSVLTQALMTASIAQGGMCAHSWEMSLVHFERYALISYIAAPVYMLCNGFIKLSLLTFYFHLSPQKWFRIAVWFGVAVVGLYTVIITTMMFFMCNPPRKAFNFKLEGTCINAGILYMATAVSNIVTDVMLFVLPIPMIYNLHMPKVQKFGAIVVFGIGSLQVTFSCIILYGLANMLSTVTTSVIRLVKLPVVLASTDPSWDAAPANIWTFIEANLFVICGSMPTLRKFFKHFLPRLMGSTGGSRYGASSSYGQQHHSGTLSRVRKPRSQYAQFRDDNATELERFSSDNKNGGTVVVGGVPSNGSNERLRDDHSERAILQTQTFTVQYSA